MPSPEVSDAGELKTSDQRTAILERAIADALAASGTSRIESRSDYGAIVVRGRPVRHLMHFFLTILTAGVWLVFWVFLALGWGESRYAVTVDEFGKVTTRKL